MDDQQFDNDTQFSHSLTKNKLTSAFSQSRFGPWNTNRQPILTRFNTLQEKVENKVLSLTKGRASKIETIQTNRQGLKKQKCFKIAESQLELSVLLLQPRLPLIRMPMKNPEDKTQISSFCLPVKSYWQPNSMSSIKNLSTQGSERSRKSLMKQLNFIRKNKRQFIKRTIRNEPLKTNKNSVRLASLKVQF